MSNQSEFWARRWMESLGTPYRSRRSLGWRSPSGSCPSWFRADQFAFGMLEWKSRCLEGGRIWLSRHCSWKCCTCNEGQNTRYTSLYPSLAKRCSCSLQSCLVDRKRQSSGRTRWRTRTSRTWRLLCKTFTTFMASSFCWRRIDHLQHRRNHLIWPATPQSSCSIFSSPTSHCPYCIEPASDVRMATHFPCGA